MLPQESKKSKVVVLGSASNNEWPSRGYDIELRQAHDLVATKEDSIVQVVLRIDSDNTKYNVEYWKAKIQAIRDSHTNTFPNQETPIPISLIFFSTDKEKNEQMVRDLSADDFLSNMLQNGDVFMETVVANSETEKKSYSTYSNYEITINKSSNSISEKAITSASTEDNSFKPTLNVILEKMPDKRESANSFFKFSTNLLPETIKLKAQKEAERLEKKANSKWWCCWGKSGAAAKAQAIRDALSEKSQTSLDALKTLLDRPRGFGGLWGRKHATAYKAVFQSDVENVKTTQRNSK